MTDAADRRFDAVIFDLDGVITDTADLHARGWERLASEEGLDFDDDLADRLRGVSRVDSMRTIAGDRGYSDDEIRELADRKNGYYVELLSTLKPSDTLPGARGLVTACRDRGMRVAICSSSRNARTVLDALDMTGHFDQITDGDAAERSKPAPDLFLHCAQQLEVEPGRCVVVEDAASGVEGANAAGMRSVGVGPPDRLGAADQRYDSVADIDVDAILG